MKNYFTNLALVAVVGMASAGFAGAGEWDKKTIITTDEAMQLPTTMLQPGTYVIKLANVDAYRHVVQIFDKDEKHIITTILAIPNERLRPTGKSVFAFWEVPAGQPKALRAWFYPGDNFGQEFAYPKEEATRITASNRSSTAVPVGEYKTDLNSSTSGDSTVTRAEAQTPAPEPVAAAEATPAPVEVAAAPQQSAPSSTATVVEDRSTPAPVTIASNTDANQTSRSAPATLPQTASNLPLVGLMGLLAFVGAVALNFAYRRA